jgi:hypothetical protein
MSAPFARSLGRAAMAVLEALSAVGLNELRFRGWTWEVAGAPAGTAETDRSAGAETPAAGKA